MQAFRIHIAVRLRLFGTGDQHLSKLLAGFACAILSHAAVSQSVRGQNLVPNPSFENFTNCPNSASQISLAPPWDTPTTGSPDYFNGCQTTPNTYGVPANAFGNESANSGNAYAGIRVYTPPPHDHYREYLEIQLSSPLVAGHVYEVSFHASLADLFKYAIENLDAYLSVGSVGPLSTSVNLPFSPQITNPTGIIGNKIGWRLISGVFTASGGEDHLVIGNFRSDPSTNIQNVGGICCSYYFIDDVSVTERTPCAPVPDGSSCEGTCTDHPDGVCSIFPSQLVYDPSTDETTFTGCACDGCFIRRHDVPPFEFFCFGDACPASDRPCRITSSSNADGTITYDCCQETACAPNAAQTECEGNCDGAGSCQPRCLRKNLSTGQTLIHECTCRVDDGCHAVAGFELPTCEGVCPPDKTCIQTRTQFTDPHSGNLYVDVCCDCEDVCPPQESAPGDLCEYFQTVGPGCVDGGPDGACLPRSVNIYGNAAISKLYPIATDCTCGPCGLVSTWGTWPTTGLPYVSALSCGGDCSPPDHGSCRLFRNDVPIGTNITVLVSSLEVLDTLRCECDSKTSPCNPNALGTACEGSCPSGLCQPTEVNCTDLHCTITECACIPDTSCHVEPVPGTTQTLCSGRCPLPLGCAKMSVDLLDGSTSHSCQCEGAPPCPDGFADDFESYSVGTICGQGGWEEWVESTNVCGTVNPELAFDGVKSIKIVGSVGGTTGLGDDMVHRLHASGGNWVFRIMTLVPEGARGIGYVNLLNTYDDPHGAPPSTYRWSVEVRFDANAGRVSATGAGNGTSLVRGRWAELRVEVDLDHDSVDSYYDGIQFVANRSWVNGASTGGRPFIQALDLYAGEPNMNGTTGMYFDAVSLARNGLDCNQDRVSDECDIANGFSPDGNETGIPDECESWGDFNGDGDTDLSDFALLLGCTRGPIGGIPVGCTAANLRIDAHIDLADLGRFQTWFSEP